MTCDPAVRPNGGREILTKSEYSNLLQEYFQAAQDEPTAGQGQGEFDYYYYLQQVTEFFAILSYRVFNIDKAMLQLEMRGQVFTQRLYAEALGGMMTGRVVVNPAFARDMYRLLGDLTADKGIQPLFHGGIDVGLCRAGTPATHHPATTMLHQQLRGHPVAL